MSKATKINVKNHVRGTERKRPVFRDSKTSERGVEIDFALTVNILERISDGFVMFDADMNYTFVNSRGGELLGRKPEDLIGKNYWKEYPEAVGTPFAKAYIRAMVSQVPIKLEDYYEPWGRWFENRIYPSGQDLSVFFSDVTERRQNEQKIRNLTRLYEIRSKINQAIVRIKDRQELFQAVCNVAVEYGSFRLSWIGLIVPERGKVEIVAHAGGAENYLRQVENNINCKGCRNGPTAMAIRKNSVIFLNDVQKNARRWPQGKEVVENGYRSLAVVPLCAGTKVIGVLAIYAPEANFFNNDEVTLLEGIGADISFALDVMAVEVELLSKLQQSNLELLSAYDETIEGWSRALDLRDKETEGHTRRVTRMALELATRMGVSDEALIHLRRGALLHDMGKMGVPDQVLFKPESLNETEWELMRQHPLYAFEMLAPISFLRPALDIPYCHHEKWNGSGYPRGLKEEEIPLAARIFAVVDVFDALTSDRSYRKGWPSEAALEYIREQSGSHFDPQAVKAFVEMIWAEKGL